MGSWTNEQAALLPPLDTLLEVRTGKIRPLGGLKLRSAISKSRRQGKIEVTELGLVGDEQQYAFHGGVDKALHQYCASHYDQWCEEKPDRAHLFKTGGYGENISTRLLTEKNVCIGDKFRVGSEVIIQVSEPRQPCYKLNHRFEWKKASIRTQESGRIGWYLRILKTGRIEEGDEIELIERPNPTWSIARVANYLFHDIDNADALNELAQLPGLGDEIVQIFKNRLLKGVEDMDNRLIGIAGKNRIPVAWHSYRLVEKTSITPRVKKFVFTIEDESVELENPSFGMYPHVRLKFGPNASFTRAYSVVDGALKKFELGIARDDNSRGGSVYLHDTLREGDVVDIAKGYEPPSKADDVIGNVKSHIIIIGGIGVTAFLRRVKELESAGNDYHIHYAVRSEAEATYLGSFNPKRTTLYAKSRGERLDINAIIPSPRDNVFETMIYCCGPQSLMKACQERTNALKYPASLVHFEDFGGSSHSTGDPFEVEVKSSGQVLKVPGDKTLLEVLNEAGLEIDSSCLAGNCGMCMVDYCSGEVVHRGVALDEEQKADSLLSCVSRGKERIVVDC
ncbi:pyruvate kinase-like protein [Xylogone sp. PMI_703]|nr:pyruvate kinase-like protein [Xylogone sp. PMI_703]